jgi:putative ABC transport system permease protein
MALGAERASVLAMILRQGMSMAAVGLLLGISGAWVSTWVMRTLLLGVQPTDAVAFASGAGVLLAAVLLACWVPARRATRVDPLEALRHE